MWKDLLNWFRVVWDTGTQTQKNTGRIEQISKHGDDLAHSFENLTTQQQHDREMSERRVESLEKEIEALRRELKMAQENTELKLRLALSEYLRQLPPPEKKPEEEKP